MTVIDLIGRNSIAWLEAFLGIMAAGAWAVPLNFRFADKDIRNIKRGYSEK